MSPSGNFIQELPSESLIKEYPRKDNRSVITFIYLTEYIPLSVKIPSGWSYANASICISKRPAINEEIGTSKASAIFCIVSILGLAPPNSYRLIAESAIPHFSPNCFWVHHFCVLIFFMISPNVIMRTLHRYRISQLYEKTKTFFVLKDTGKYKNVLCIQYIRTELFCQYQKKKVR